MSSGSRHMRIILTPVIRSVREGFSVPERTGWLLHACGTRVRHNMANDGFMSRSFQRMTNLVDREWHKSSQAPAESVRGYVYKYGQRLLSRLPSEEYFMRDLNNLEIMQPTVIYPESLPRGAVEGYVAEVAAERRKLHQRLLKGSIAFVPVTVLFSFVPIIPNFFLAWNLFRLYCHLMAGRGASKLEDMLSDGSLKYESNVDMSKLLTDGTTKGTDAEAAEPDITFIDQETRVRLGEALDAPDLPKTLQRGVRELERRFHIPAQRNKEAHAAHAAVTANAAKRQIDKPEAAAQVPQDK